MGNGFFNETGSFVALFSQFNPQAFIRVPPPRPAAPPSHDQAPPLPTQQATHFPARSPPSLGPSPPLNLPRALGRKLTNNKEVWAAKAPFSLHWFPLS